VCGIEVHSNGCLAVRASMIWILGEYAERIDNADELLGSFLEAFQDEDTQVCMYVCMCVCIAWSIGYLFVWVSQFV